MSVSLIADVAELLSGIGYQQLPPQVAGSCHSLGHSATLNLQSRSGRPMDIFAHALWTTAAAATARRRLRQRIHLGWAAFWGIFPDLFSFVIPAVVRIWWYLSGTTHSLMPDAHSPQHFQFVWTLYHSSHSLLVFAAVFALVWAIARRPVLELLGWGLHILIDIPTHQGMFAIHFLWPLSSYGFNGIRWESHWFLAANYSVLALVYGWMWIRSRRTSSAATAADGKLSAEKKSGADERT